MTKLKLMGKNHSDELYTPECAINILLPYLKKEWTIYECAWGTGKLAKHLENKGFKVTGDFVNCINDVCSTKDYYWMYYINGQAASVGAGGYLVENNDTIEFIYEK
jgi:hypothetical protein